MIRLQSVSREYHTKAGVVYALRNIDVHIKEGQFAVLMGPSGSGKSTMLNILGCLDVPTGGRYILDQTDVTALPDSKLVAMRRFKLGFVFQSFHLIPRQTALRNVELPMVFAGVSSKERRERSEKSLDAVGLSHRITHRPDELSGGEMQRVAIARSLVMDPPVLLADEPTGNLDTKSGREIIDLLINFSKKGRTIVMVTHDERYARIGDMLIRLEDGGIKEMIET